MAVESRAVAWFETDRLSRLEGELDAALTGAARIHVAAEATRAALSLRDASLALSGPRLARVFFFLARAPKKKQSLRLISYREFS